MDEILGGPQKKLWTPMILGRVKFGPFLALLGPNWVFRPKLCLTNLKIQDIVWACSMLAIQLNHWKEPKSYY